MSPEESKTVIDTLNANTIMVQEMSHELKRLSTAISGDDSIGHKGIAERLEDSEEAHSALKSEVRDEVESLHNKMSWAKGGAWAVAVCVAVMGFFKDHIRWM
jgi:signal transduction histidine kinase